MTPQGIALALIVLMAVTACKEINKKAIIAFVIIALIFGVYELLIVTPFLLIKR